MGSSVGSGVGLSTGVESSTGAGTGKKSLVPSWLQAELARRQGEAAKKAAASAAAGSGSDEEDGARKARRGDRPAGEGVLVKEGCWQPLLRQQVLFRCLD